MSSVWVASRSTTMRSTYAVGVRWTVPKMDVLIPVGEVEIDDFRFLHRAHTRFPFPPQERQTSWSVGGSPSRAAIVQGWLQAEQRKGT